MPCIFRYLSPEYAEAFVQKGEVLFRALSYFRDYEDEGVRADEFEGTLVHRPEDGLKIRLAKTGEEVSVPYTFESTAREDDIFVCCMSMECSQLLASRFKVAACVEILEPSKFLFHLRTALARRPRVREKQLVHDVVKYYELHEPPIVDWALPERIALRKPKAFTWQREYRFAVPMGTAFRVENVNVKLVPLGSRRPPRVTSHPKMLLKLGNLSKLCRIHNF
jgi:hypothetical protein